MDWIAALLEIAGAWLVGNKNKWGFVVFMFGNVLWIITGSQKALGGLIFVSIIFFCINVRNFRKWLISERTT